MGNAPLHLVDEDPLVREAVGWFLRVEREDASLEELKAWQLWLELSSAHQQAYESVRQTWQALDRVPDLPWPTDPEVAADAFMGETSIARWRAGARADAGAAYANPSQFKPQRKWQWTLGVYGVAALALVGMIALAIHTYRSGYRSESLTAVAEHRTLTLPDGSSIAVGASSQVQIRFSAAQREVKLLTGEAFFTVARDAQRPFTVDAGVGRVTAIGTAFNIRRYGSSFSVEVSEGRVRLDASANDSAPIRTPLSAGQEAMLNDDGILQAVRSVHPKQIAAWREGRHHYIDEPLAVVIADLNRYTNHRIVIDDDALAALRVTTTFFSGDWQGWLATLELAVPEVRVHREAGSTHLRPSNSSAGHS